MLNVKDYGAIGDGTTDDTAAIQAALDVGSGRVFAPVGTYAITSTLGIGPFTSLVGEGYGISTIKQANGANIDGALLASKTYLEDSTTTSQPIQICDLTLDGNSANNPTGVTDGIVLLAWHSLIENVDVKNLTQDGIKFRDRGISGTPITNSSVESRVNRCRINSCGRYGFFNDDSTGKVTDGFLIDNIIGACGAGIYFAGGVGGWLVQGNHVYASVENNIEIIGGFNARIIGNYSEKWAAGFRGLIVGAGAIVLGNTSWPLSGLADFIGSVTYDPPNLAKGTQATTSLTVTGASFGDVAKVSFSQPLQGITLTGFVSGANTVTCAFFNGTGGNVNLGSGTLKALVVRV